MLPLVEHVVRAPGAPTRIRRRGIGTLASAVLGLSVAASPAAAAVLPWVLKFSDPGGTSGAAVTKYFKDGSTATVAYTANGLEINAPSGHTVVWTKTSFTGDIRIEFDYKRLNVPRVGINEGTLLVVNGWGLSRVCPVDQLTHPLDIRAWARPVATYDVYKFCMANQTVSFDNLDRGTDPRLTVRQNPGYHDMGTIIPPKLQTGVLYHVTVTRTGNTLKTLVKRGTTVVASLTATLNPSLPGSQVSKFGYVGFRQMTGRRAAYRNIKIFTR